MPEHDELELSRYWNEITGTGSGIPGDLDATDVALVHRLESLAAAPLPVSARERVWHGLLDTWEALPDKEQTMLTSDAVLRPDTTYRNGSVRRIRLLEPPLRHRWLDRPLTYLALAATLLVMIGGIAAIVRDQRSNPGSATSAPAIFAPGTPEQDLAADQTLLEITIPAEIVPHSAERHVGLSHEAYGPNSRASWVPYCCDGPVIQHQLTGAITVRAEAPIQIVRADRTTEEIQANVEVTVNTGDTLILLNQTGIETVNSGSTPAEILSWVFLDDPGDKFSGRTGQDGMTGQFVLDYADDIGGSLVEIPGAATVRLQRLAIEADERVDTPAGSTMLAITLDRSRETVIRAGDGSYIKATNTRGEPTTAVYVVTLSPAEDTATPAP